MAGENMTQQLFSIIKASIWGGDMPPITPAIRQELQAQTIEGLTGTGNLKYSQTAQFVWMVKAQDDALHLIQEADIPVVVMKGTASGIYYPQPYLRTYGDIDLLVQPENYEKAIAALQKGGWRQSETIGRYHTALYKDSFILELHQSPPDLDEVKEGKYILDYLLSGFNDIQEGRIAQPLCKFPMLPWKQNGLELIWHFREHLYNGIGLRHAIDWMMYVHEKLHTEQAYEEFRPILEKAGLLQLGKSVARMCQIYLGLDNNIVWCKDVDTKVCEDLMSFMLEQGNFGHKRIDDKESKVLSRYRTPVSIFKGMQKKGIENWEAARRYPLIHPFAWVYTVAQIIKQYGSKNGISKLNTARSESRQRQVMLDQLYGKNSIESAWRIKRFKDRITPLYNRVRGSFLRVPLFHIQNAYFVCRYWLYGKPKISAEDRANVEANVTFIYKSFNRQKLAKRVYHSIKTYYPKVRVVIADDSQEPLQIADLAEKDLILHLPFNSGLSKGLIAALAEVRTPYVMRMDDDELLIPASRIYDQLSFLQKHPEVDLAGIQAKHRNPERGAEVYSRIRMSERLIIPAGTIIDGREVVYKTANVFVARTDSMRAVGYDPNIHLIDHHEFFFRAAGQIVCVQDRTASIFHCHNYFAKKDEKEYRSKLSGDLQYIASKQRSGYR